MRYRFFIHILIPFILWGIASCGDPGEVVTSSVDQKNFILNSSFELAGEPSNDGWSFGGAPFVKYAYQAPPSGGNICVLIKALDLGGAIRKTIPLPEGKNAYRFSLWGKINYYPGEVYFSQKRAGGFIKKRSISIEDTTWTHYSFVDTLDSGINDSLHIEVNGSNLYKVQAYTWIDLIQVEALK